MVEIAYLDESYDDDVFAMSALIIPVHVSLDAATWPVVGGAPARQVRMIRHEWASRNQCREQGARVAEPRHLRHAPIREAILDLRVKARPELGPEDFEPALPALRETFPHVEKQGGLEAEIHLASTVEASQSRVRDLGFQRYLLKSDDGKSIIQLRVDGFTFNRLSPYTRWEEILPTVLQTWAMYVEAARPELVSRIGLRYINRIPLPPGLDDFGELLAAGPQRPPEWPQYVSGFVTQVVMHDPDTGLSATVRQSLETGVTTREAAVLLDIDAYDLEQCEPDSPDIERIFNDLRSLKNRIFFGSLTDRAVKRFE